MTRSGDGWIQTFSGRQYWPCEPQAGDVAIEDIAHHLSNQCRFSGAVFEFYSVAEHSVRVSLEVERRLTLIPGGVPLATVPVTRVEVILASLLHDAAEAYLVDLPRPIKRSSALGAEYAKLEEANLKAIFERCELPVEIVDADLIKTVDNVLLMTEMRDLMEKPPKAWKESWTHLPLKEVIAPWKPQKAEKQFLARFDALDKMRLSRKGK